MARYTPADLTPKLPKHTLEQGAAALADLDCVYELVPSTHRAQFASTVDALLDAAAVNHFTSLQQVVEEWAWLVALAARMPKDALTKPDSLEEADRAHLFRNTLLTLVVAALAAHPGTTPENVAAKMAGLPQRTTRPLRAHTDDEILLLRMWTLHMSLCGNKNSIRTAAVYAEIDAGLNAGETTEIEPRHTTFASDLVVDGSPTTGWIEAPGLRGVANRDIDLHPFNGHLLRNHIDRTDLDKHKFLTYWPRTKDYTSEVERYAKGCASVYTAMNTIRKHIGLHHADTTTSSITEWRIRHILPTHDYDAALKISGRNRTCLNGRLKDRNPSHEPEETHPVNSRKTQMLDI